MVIPTPVTMVIPTPGSFAPSYAPAFRQEDQMTVRHLYTEEGKKKMLGCVLIDLSLNLILERNQMGEAFS